MDGILFETVPLSRQIPGLEDFGSDLHTSPHGGDAMTIGFIGAGKVGCTLGKYFSTHGAAVTGYYDRNTQAAKEAAQFT